MSAGTATRRRRWLAPEVVQTSAMDCGPATLKCLLEGFGVAVSYGRLREACQTDVDGTSIDTLEDIANQLGVPVEQIAIPLDHVLLPPAAAVPAIAVTRHRDGAPHFVVVWRRHGEWLQVMDPSIGRRWVQCTKFSEELFRHTQSVRAAAWRQWAGTEDALAPLRSRVAAIGGRPADVEALVESALSDSSWFRMGVLDASVRLVQSLVTARGVARGGQAVKVLRALLEQTCASVPAVQSDSEEVDLFKLIPPHYWSVTPDPATTAVEDPQLLLHGAVLLRVISRQPPTHEAAADERPGAARPLTPELHAALHEQPAHPLRTVWSLLKADGIFAPLALIGAMVVAAGAIAVEMLLFRGLFDLAGLLTQPVQRAAAVAGIVAFVAILLVIQVPIVLETARFGRHLELRLRMALLRKLPRLTDRYFHSRPISDMAERSHSIQMVRHVPALGLQVVQTFCELALTLLGIAFIDRSAVALAFTIAALAVGLSLVAQPMINERDLRVRNHAAALYGFYLDALLGLVPVRTHAAEKAVSRQHEGLLVEWARSSRGLSGMSVLSGGAQAFLCMVLAGYLVVDHFLRSGGVSGGDLLLVYWVLKLPAIGATIAALAHSYPGQRNALLRLLEPLSAPEEAAVSEMPERTANDSVRASARIGIRSGHVLAAGHVLLQGLELDIAPGEHVAIVGRSGAGKSTLLSVLLGWHRLAGGQLELDGRPVTGAEVEAFRRQVAWVDPAIQIWNASLLDNIGYATADGGLDRLGGVVEPAGLREVMKKLPLGLQTVLGEGGGLLSGGEGQRVRLARAFLQTNVRLALLDEPFRGMDRARRRALLTEVRQWWQTTTLLCITHDVSETLDFSRVLVIDNGRIVEDGVPTQLATRPSRYRELLQAELRVRKQLWAGKHWRRLHIDDGRVTESDA